MNKETQAIADTSVAATKQRLHELYGDSETERIDRGLAQTLRLWRQDDGDAETFRQFVESEFMPTGTRLDDTFDRLEFAFERLGGLMTSLARDLRRGADVEVGPLLPIDQRLAGYNPAAHMGDDLFAQKIAFTVLLNFPLSTLEERIAKGAGWSRRQWAEARLTDGFESRVPAEVFQTISVARAASSAYVSNYNLYMHHVLAADGRRLFPAGLRLISHWGLRDELKACYADPQGLEKQQLVKTVLDRIVRQEIPAVVIDSPLFDWNPEKQTVVRSTVESAEPPAGVAPVASTAPEGDERYRQWIGNFRASQGVDPYRQDNPTLMARSFNVSRQIPEAKVRELFESVLSSPLRQEVGEEIRRRLGRELEPFDIWYVGFKPRGRHGEAELDALVRERYPDIPAFAADLPRILRDVGLSEKRARFVAERVVIEPSRGAGHAYGAARRDDKTHLRTRVSTGGMDYQGYNVALHELGHNVEQVFSTTTIDHTLLRGVPNTAFTEAIAFFFQNQDLQLLGLAQPDAESLHQSALDTFWATREIAAVSLVDMDTWHWLYENPEATPAQLREAVLGIARGIWNRYFADVFGVRDETLLAIYSHMINRSLYTPDYPLGHMITFQIEQHFEGYEGHLGDELERICQLGKLTPEAWMQQAVGTPLSSQPLLVASASGLKAVSGST